MSEASYLLCNRKFLWNPLLHKKYYRTVAEWNNVAKATRRRRRILRSRILSYKITKRAAVHEIWAKFNACNYFPEKTCAKF